MDRDHGGPRGPDVVEGTAFYEGFQSSFVVGLRIDALAEVEDVLEGPSSLAARIESTQESPTFLTAESPKRIVSPTTVKRRPLVDVGRSTRYLHRPGLGDILGHPIFGIHHAAQGRHVRLGIVGF